MPHTFVHNRVLFLLALFKPFFVALDQALAQCENTLTKLGLVREAVDDTAGAAKVCFMFLVCLYIHTHNLQWQLNKFVNLIRSKLHSKI
jgi:hypothetical protein